MQSKINPRAAKTLRSALHPNSAFFASIIAFAVILSVTAPGMTAILTPLLALDIPIKLSCTARNVKNTKV
jgi:hypothetical protein